MTEKKRQDGLWSPLTDKPNGEIRIVFRRNAEGKTYMARSLWKIPLQILKPHYYDVDGTAVVYSLNPAANQHDQIQHKKRRQEPDRDHHAGNGNLQRHLRKDKTEPKYRIAENYGKHCLRTSCHASPDAFYSAAITDCSG